MKYDEIDQIILDTEAETSGLYVASPKSVATLNLLGRFVHLPNPPTRYSWSKHREWIIANSDRDNRPPREVSTQWQYQVYVVNTTHAETCIAEHPYVCWHLMPFGDEKKALLFHKGFICAGCAHNNGYNTATRPEDETIEQIDEETFGAKLFFLDETRLGRNLKTLHSKSTDIMLTARVRQNKVIAFRSKVRTNAYFVGGHGAFTQCDTSYRGYEKNMGGWKVERDYSDRFQQSSDSQKTLIEEVRYHNSIQLLIYRFITNTAE